VFEIAFTLAFCFRMGRNFLNGGMADRMLASTRPMREYLAMGYPHPLPLLEPWMCHSLRCCCVARARPSSCTGIDVWHCASSFGCAFYAQGVDYFGAFAYNKIFIATYALLATGPGLYRDDHGRLVVSAAMVRMIQATPSA